MYNLCGYNELLYLLRRKVLHCCHSNNAVDEDSSGFKIVEG